MAKFRKGQWVQYNGSFPRKGSIGQVEHLTERRGSSWVIHVRFIDDGTLYGCYPNLLKVIPTEVAAVEVAKKAMNIKQET